MCAKFISSEYKKSTDCEQINNVKVCISFKHPIVEIQCVIYHVIETIIFFTWSRI